MKYFLTLFLIYLPKKSIIFIIFFLFSIGCGQTNAQVPYAFDKLIDLSNSLNASRLKVDKDTSWHKMELGANFNQGSFSSQWTGGGVSSLGIGLLFNALFEKKKGGNAWRNDLQTQYGFAKNEGQGSRKNMDRIFFDTKYNRDVSAKCAIFANINFQSQFAGGYDYSLNADSVMTRRKVSRFAAPAYFTQSIGVEYKPADYFFLDFAPGAFRQTIVWDKNLFVNTPDQNNYGVAIGSRVRYEVALMQIVANFNKDISKQMNLKFRYQFYSGLPDPFKIDSRLDASLTARLNKYINVNFSAIMVYNEDQSTNVQLAQGMNIGFLYSF